MRFRFGKSNNSEVPSSGEQSVDQSSGGGARAEARGTREIFLGKQVGDPVTLSYADGELNSIQVIGSVKAINKSGEVWEFVDQELRVSGGSASFSKTTIEGLDNVNEPAIVVETLTESGEPEFKMLRLAEISSIS